MEGIANANRFQREATVRTIVDLVLDMFIRRAGSKQRNAPVAWAILFAVLTAGCTDGTTGPGASDFKRPTSITLSPNTFIVDEGDSIQFIPHFTGEDVPANRVVWKVEPGYWASITTRGVLHGEISGMVTVTARYGELESSVTGQVRPVPALLEPASALNQIGSVAAAVPETVAVRVVSTGQAPVPGVDVLFQVVAGSGTVSSRKVKTDGDGIASTVWVLGPQPGEHRLKASAEGLGEASFEAVARSATSITQVSGDQQTTWAGQPLDKPLRVKLLDDAGNPVAGQAVSWSVVAGEGSITVAGLTNRDGISSAAWTLGTQAGVQEARAEIPGLNPVDFSAMGEQLSLSSLNASEESIAFSFLGQVAALTAEARDESGNLVPSAKLRWTSLNPSVVKVDSMGVVTSRGAGTTLVVVAAFCCSVADTIQAQVSPPAAPPPGSAQAVFADDFELGEYRPNVNGFGHGGSKIPVTTEQAHSGRYSLKFVYGPDAPGEDSWAEHRFRLGDGVQEVWVEYYVRAPLNYAHRDDQGSDNNKFFFVDDRTRGTYNVRMLLEGRPDPVAGSITKARPMWGTSPELGGRASSSWGMENPSGLITNESLGKWVHFRFHLKVSDTGQRNGIFKMWRDDVLFINEIGLANDPVDGVSNRFKGGYLMGWSNSGFTEQTVFYLDDFKIYTGDPGW